MNILALDIGTTSLRGVLYASSGQLLGSKSVVTPVEHSGSYIEQKPDRLSNGIVDVCRTLSSRFPIDAISITAYRSALCLTDASGQPMCNFIMWQDTRNCPICKRFEKDSQYIYSRSGACPNTVFTATRILWLKENRPEMYRSAFKVTTVPDYIIHYMTDKFVTDRTYGSRTHLMNIKTLQWDPDLCDLFGIDQDLLCPLIEQGSVAGFTTEAFARKTGIPAGIPVISAGGDQQCGALGLGVVDSDQLEINCGTGSFVISTVDRPILDNPSMICNVSAIPGKYIVESNILSSASALNWLMKEFFPELWGENPDFARLNEIVAQVPAGANGMLCLPHFQGCGTRCWNASAKAAFWGMTLCSTRADMARALYEGVAGEIAKSVQSLPEQCRNATSIRIAGGLTKSDIFNQILSNMLGHTLLRFSNPQATSIGAAVSAAVTLGIYPDYATALNAIRAADTVDSFSAEAKTAAMYRNLLKKTERVYQFGLDL